MLSNLASYLGYATPSAKASVVENASAEMRLRAVEEDEWLLVENETSLMSKEVEEDAEMTRVTLSTSIHPGSLHSSSKGLSRSASLDIISPLQESWYLTPPPSFTSEGPVHMETSPLENLLIEHPSMSVYERTTQRVDASRKMTNSSPCGIATSGEERPASLKPIKERMYKLSRNKLNIKLSKKQSSTSPSPAPTTTTAATTSVPLENEELLNEPKESKMKNFVKSPRRSINSELQSLPKKAFRKRPEKTSMGSKSSTPSQVSIREEQSSEAAISQPRRLYSEVLASKPSATVSTVQTSDRLVSSPEPRAPESNLETSAALTEIAQTPEEVPTEVTDETAMSVKEAQVQEEEEEEEEEEREEVVTEESVEGRDGRRMVQALPDRQLRLHFLTRSAQKVEQRKACDQLKKNPLIRTNKAREFNFRNKRQRRSDMMQHHSGVNNNRKCAKTVVY